MLARFTKKIVLFFLCIGILINTYSQDKKNLKKLLKEANKAFEYEHFRTARHLYKDYLNLNPHSAFANYRLGICDIYTFDYEQGLQLIEKAVSNDPSVDEYVDLWLGRAYHLNYKFQEAITHYEKYIAKLKPSTQQEFIDQASKHIEECQNGIKLCAVPSNYKIRNVGDVLNSPYSEHSPVITQDGLTMYFTSRRDHDDIKNLQVHEGEYSENIYVSHLLTNGQWTAPQPLASLETGSHHEATVELFDNDNKMLIYKNNNQGDIYISEKVGDSLWSKPSALNVNSKASETDAYISADESTLIFTSSAHSHLDRGDLDLYISIKKADGKWGEPEPLSETINTPYNENAPFLSKDGKTLFFSSTGHNTMGGYDVFKSELDSISGQWSEPINVGHPVNTPGDDIYFYYSDDNSWNGYFSSYRAGGMGEKDIYHVQFIPNVSVLGTVSDVNTKKPVEGMEVVFVPQEDIVSSEVDNKIEFYANNTNDKGNYKVNVLSNQTYDVFLLLNGDTLKKEKYNIPFLNEHSGLVFTQDFKVDVPQELEKALMASNKMKDTYDDRIKEIEQKETNKVVANNTTSSSSPQKSNASFVYRDSEQENSVATSNVRENSTTKEQALTHFNLEEKQFVSGCRSVLRNVYFEFDKAELRPESYEELNNLTCLLTEYPDARLEISGHTDNVGTHKYNMTLSQKRAEAIVSYLIQQGVEESRLEAKGYGETRPLASNDDEKEGRMLNRRTEFLVLSNALSGK